MAKLDIAERRLPQDDRIGRCEARKSTSGFSIIPTVRGESIALRILDRGVTLEFKVPLVMACDDRILPLQSRLEAVADETELDNVFETERHLLYVASTRARPADDLGRASRFRVSAGVT